MHLNISVNSSLPADTHVVMGFVGNVNFILDLTSATQEQKDTVSDFVNLVGKNAVINVENFNVTEYFESAIVLPEETTIDEITIDYDLLSNTDKVIVDSYVSMITNLNN